MIILNVLKCMPFIISVMAVSFALLQLRLCQQFYKPVFSGVQNLAVRSGYRLKPGIKHPGLGAIKFISEKANKGFGLEILQKGKEMHSWFWDTSSACSCTNMDKGARMSWRRQHAGELVKVGKNYCFSEKLSFAYLLFQTINQILSEQLSNIHSIWN